MNRLFLSAFLATVLATPVGALGGDAPAKDDIQRGVVKIFAVQRIPYFLRPWTTRPVQMATGSGLIIEGHRIVTNAHVVAFASQIEVQPFESSKRYPATVTAISTGMDLAVLEMKDKLALGDRKAIEIYKGLPEVKDAIHVYGYPIGGDALAVTQGTLTRIEYERYNEGQAGLKLEISATINPGNSGGPVVLDNNKVVGLVFEASQQNNNIGYAIPCEEILAFLQGVKEPGYIGKVRMVETLYSLENEALRAKLGVSDKITGVLVGEPTKRVPNNPLKENDVITKIGKYDIDNLGMINFDGKLRTSFLYLVPKVAKGGRIPLTLYRAGNLVTTSYPVKAREGEEIVSHLGVKYPSYVVWGPLAFSPATVALVGTIYPYMSATWIARRSPLITRSGDFVDFPGQQLVVVTAMFPHKTTRGYSSPVGQVVSKVNGTPIKNLRHLRDTLQKTKDRFVEFEFADKYVEKLVFDRQEVMDATENILSDNGIRQPLSQDLRDGQK